MSLDTIGYINCEGYKKIAPFPVPPLYYYLSAVLGCSARLHCVCSRFDCTFAIHIYSTSSNMFILSRRFLLRVIMSPISTTRRCTPGAWRSDPYRSGGRHQRSRTFASGTFLERVDYFSCISPPPASGQLRQFMIGRKENERKKNHYEKRTEKRHGGGKERMRRKKTKWVNNDYFLLNKS